MTLSTPSGRPLAVVTGAASGIGRALARELAARGHDLAICDIDEVGLKTVAEDARAAGVEVQAMRVDLGDTTERRGWVDAVIDRFGVAHLVINNAGVALAGEAGTQDMDDVDWLLDINLRAVIDLSEAFLPHLIASGDGHLVNISSIFGFVTVPAQSAYHAAKFGVRGYTDAIGMDLALAGAPVKVTCIHPGGIKTNIARNARNSGAFDRDGFTDLFDQVATTSPERAATVILKAVERGRRRAYIGADARVVAALERTLGAAWMPTMQAIAKRVLPAVKAGSTAVGDRLRRDAEIDA